MATKHAHHLHTQLLPLDVFPHNYQNLIHLCLSSISMSSKSLFPDSSSDLLHSDSSLSFLFGNKREESNQEQEQSLNTILGGNLHQLKPDQVEKIILTKYNNDPIQLIQQLSLDLTEKETELVVLRQEKFRREQKL